MFLPNATERRIHTVDFLLARPIPARCVLDLSPAVAEYWRCMRVPDRLRKLLGLPRVDPPPIYGPGTVAVGRHTYWGAGTWFRTFTEADRIEIGSFCSMADRVQLLAGGEHHPEWVSTFPLRIKLNLPGSDEQPFSRGPIVIGHDVWLGSAVTVLSGVEIGNGAVVGASALVTEDIPPYAIAVGVPAKVIGMRFPPEVCEALQRIAWWNWDDAAVAERVDDICSPDVDGFIAKYDRTTA